jgi:hypothetical protein
VEAPLITQGQRSSDRTRSQPQRYGSLVIENKDVLLLERGEPTTYREAFIIVLMKAPKEFGFLQNPDEPCVYKKVSGSTIVFLVLYVADILLIGSDITILKIMNLRWVNHSQ